MSQNFDWVGVLFWLFVATVFVVRRLSSGHEREDEEVEEELMGFLDSTFKVKNVPLRWLGYALYSFTVVIWEPTSVSIRFLWSFLLAPMFLFPLTFVLVVLLFILGLEWFGTFLIVMGFISGVFALLMALLPVGASILALVGAGGGRTLTRFALGARPTSRREEQIIQDALSFPQFPENTRAPSDWFVIDSPMENAYVLGSTLYVTRGLIEKPYLSAVLAHEMAHVNLRHHGQLALALRRLVIPPIYLITNFSGQTAPGTFNRSSEKGSSDTLSEFDKFLKAAQTWLWTLFLSVVGGGYGVWLLNPLYVWYWRQCEYEADDLAAQWGAAAQLLEYLEMNKFFDSAVPYFLSPQPYTELRIDRLLVYVES